MSQLQKIDRTMMVGTANGPAYLILNVYPEWQMKRAAGTIIEANQN